MITNFLSIISILQVDIEKNMENAPDKGYEIGVAVGTYLPFVILVIIAYFIFNMAKKKNDLED